MAEAGMAVVLRGGSSVEWWRARGRDEGSGDDDGSDDDGIGDKDGDSGVTTVAAAATTAMSLECTTS